MERSKVDLVDVEAFLQVVEAGGFARAAERTGLAKSILSRRVTRLEGRLGAKLLTRTARGVQPTHVGEAYAAKAAGVLHELESAAELVQDAVQQIAGPIRLSAPLTFGVRHMAPALADFAAAHPKVELDVSFTDKVIDLVGGGYDLAVRIGDLPDSQLLARRVAPVRSAVLASPAWIAAHGCPEHPRDLEGCDMLVYANPGRNAGELWRFPDGAGHIAIRGRTRLRADNGDLLREAAVAGLGAVILPTFIASPAIESGALEILLPRHPLPETGLHLVMPPGRALTARVRALVDHLATRFGPEPGWDPCWTGTA